MIQEGVVLDVGQAKGARSVEVNRGDKQLCINDLRDRQIEMGKHLGNDTDSNTDHTVVLPILKFGRSRYTNRGDVPSGLSFLRPKI